jgi:hypothetical protein
MGQLARMNRAARFIEEFEADILPLLSVQPGMNCEITNISLCSRDGEGEEVVAVATIKVFNGPEITVELDEGILYDPEYSGQHDVAEDLAGRYGFDEDDVLQRLIDADC